MVSRWSRSAYRLLAMAIPAMPLNATKNCRSSSENEWMAVRLST